MFKRPPLNTFTEDITSKHPFNVQPRPERRNGVATDPLEPGGPLNVQLLELEVRMTRLPWAHIRGNY